MKVLVTGGAGYIGGAVTDLLIQRKIDFTVLDNLTYEEHYLKPVDFIRGDVTERIDFSGYTHVIWLAALVGDGACALTPARTVAVNEYAIETMAQLFHGRILFTSTCSVYGEHHDEVDELACPKPLSLYATTKLNAESHLKDKNALIFRLGTAFGISDTYSRPRMDLVVNQMAVAAITKAKINLYGGRQWRPMIHVRDIARAIVGNLDRDTRGIYNLATVNMTIGNLAEKIRLVAEKNIYGGCLIQHRSSVYDGRNYRVSTEKADRDQILETDSRSTIEFAVNQFKTLIVEGRVNNFENNRYFNVRHLEVAKGMR